MLDVSGNCIQDRSELMATADLLSNRIYHLKHVGFDEISTEFVWKITRIGYAGPVNPISAN